MSDSATIVCSRRSLLATIAKAGKPSYVVSGDTCARYVHILDAVSEPTLIVCITSITQE